MTYFFKKLDKMKSCGTEGMKIMNLVVTINKSYIQIVGTCVQSLDFLQASHHLYSKNNLPK